MAKTVKNESKTKTSGKKNNNVVETTTKENMISGIIDESDEPVLVNLKNEIIYEPDVELKKIMDGIEPIIPTEFIDDDVKKGIDYLKNDITFSPDENIAIETNIETIEKQIEELSEIKKNIMKNNTTTKFNFTSFWNGTTNKW